MLRIAATLPRARHGEQEETCTPGRRNLVLGPVFPRLVQAMAECQESDAALMDRVRQGDREAFEALVLRYQQPVLSFVHRILRDSSW